MKNHFLLIMILLVASLSLASPVLAQQNQTDTDALETVDLENCDEPEAIDSITVLCSAELDGEYAELVLKSDRDQRVTVTDAGGIMEPGPINRQRFTLRENEENTVRIRITQVDGFAGVSVDTGRVLYGVPIEQNSELIGPPWGPTDAQMAALGGSSSVAAITVLLAFRRLAGSSDGPERVA